MDGDSGTDMTGRGGREPDAALRVIWDRYGDAVLDLVRRRLGGDPAVVEAACLEVAFRLSREAALSDDAPHDAAWWAWLRELTETVCERIQESGELPVPTIGVLLVDARLGVRDQIRARRGMFGLAALVGRRLQRAAEDAVRSAREGLRRVEVAIGVPSGQRVARLGELFTGASGLTEVAAVVTAVMAVGIAGPGPAYAASPPRLDAVAYRSAPVFDAWAPDETAVRIERSPASADGPASPTSGPTITVEAPLPPPPPEGQVGPAPPTPPVQPRITADPGQAASAPVREEQHGDDTIYVTPDGGVGVDADGDGEDETSVGPPYAGVDCPKPEERGAVTGVLCPVLEDDGLS